MEEKLKVIHITDIINKNIMIELANHISTKREDSGNKECKWFARIISIDTYNNEKEEIKKLKNVLLYASEYEIIHSLAYGYLKTMNVTINEHKLLNSLPGKKNTVLYLHLLD